MDVGELEDAPGCLLKFYEKGELSFECWGELEENEQNRILLVEGAVFYLYLPFRSSGGSGILLNFN